MSRSRFWIAPAVATVAFIAALAALALVLFRLSDKVGRWAQSDVDARAEIAAAALSEPLRTLDFRTIGNFADKIRHDGLRLRIVAGRGNRLSEGSVRAFYDTDGELSPGGTAYVWGAAPAGDFTVGVGRSSGWLSIVYFAAGAIAAPAGLVGVLAMCIVFLSLYRQRVRIRELARLEKFRRDFIADVSHEIKTPLTGILGAADMLEGDSPLVPLIKRESARLNALVQSILDLARLEREGDVLNLAETDLAGLVREVASRYPCRCEVAERCVAVCDPQLVEQAVANLIENAVRHSGSDDIRVSLACSGGMAEIAVEDRGVGVPPDQAERIFERFHRVDPARAAETGGAGLGLAIVRRIARLHGGDATLYAVRPHGARFAISIPLTNH